MRSKIMANGGLALALIILLVLALFTWRDMENAAIAARDVDRTYMALHKLDQIFSDLKDAEAGQRGYVITGKEEFLKPYQRSVGEIEQRLADMRELTGNGSQRERINEISDLVADKLAQLKDTVEIRKTKGYDAAKQVVVSGIGEELMGRIRAAADAARIEETTFLNNKAEARRAAVRRLRGALIVGGIASFVLLLTAFIVLRNEIAARVLVEEELRKHQEGLEHLVAERTRDLAVTNSRLIHENAMREQAEVQLKKSLEEVAHSNRELDLFASIASHDLRAPLRTITGFLEMLAQKYRGKLDDKARGYIAFAVSGAERMNTLLHDLYVYSRIGTEAKQFAPVNLDAVLTAASNNLKRIIDENRAVIRSEALPRIEGDEMQLIQLFQNLVGNAIKFRKKEAAPTIRISVSGQQGMREWTVGIHDNGIGIDQAYYERIFRIFERLHRAEEYPGTGLGLALCKKIVDRHGGRMWVESKPGQGSSFYFTLPKSEAAGGDCTSPYESAACDQGRAA